MHYFHEKIKDAQCELCKTKFRDNFALKNHIKTVHEKQKNFMCYICEKNFSAKFCLVTHLENIHKEKMWQSKVLNPE